MVLEVSLTKKRISVQRAVTAATTTSQPLYKVPILQDLPVLRLLLGVVLELVAFVFIGVDVLATETFSASELDWLFFTH